jgi:phosphoribosylformylglycinamidine synthase
MAEGSRSDVFGSSEYAKTIFKTTWGAPPALDIYGEQKLQEFLQRLANRDLASSARDISDGGFATALAEACMGRTIGARVTFGDHFAIPSRALEELFSEHPSRALISCRLEEVDQIEALCEEIGWIFVSRIGTTGGRFISISAGNHSLIEQPLDEIRDTFEGTLQSTLSVDTVTA